MVDARVPLLDSVRLWLAVGGAVAALAALPLSVGAVQRVGDESLWTNGWFRLGMFMAMIGAISLLWALVLVVAHRYVGSHRLVFNDAASGMIPGAPIDPATDTVPVGYRRIVYEDEDVRLHDLLDGSLTLEGATLRGLTFRNCRINGPAVVHLAAASEIVQSTFDERVDMILLPLQPDDRPHGIVGPIQLLTCRFIRCDFRMVGILDSPEHIEIIRRGLGGDEGDTEATD